MSEVFLSLALAAYKWLRTGSGLEPGRPSDAPAFADPCLHNPLPAPLPLFFITPINPRYMNILVIISNSLSSGIPDLYGHFIFSLLILKNIQINRFS